TATDRNNLQLVVSRTGGKYTEITLSMVDSTTLGAGRFVPDIVNAVNFAISQAFSDQADFDIAPDVSHPYGTTTVQQVTSPIVGTVNLEGARDWGGAALPLTNIENPNTGTPIPQRSNIMITSGFSLPGFGMKMTAIRTYRPVADSTKPIGYKFVSDGTKLWDASTPTPASRNIYTSLPDGTLVAFTTANATTLRPYLRAASDAAAVALIDYIRNQPLGAIVDSTPAIMD